MRPNALSNLLNSVTAQSLYPKEILIIDGSIDNSTELLFSRSEIKNLFYYKVPPEHRGLTKQRNFGVSKVSSNTEVVCFLDDDVILDGMYFENLLSTYYIYPDAMGVGGYITNEVEWEVVDHSIINDVNYFYFDGYRRKESSRYKLRKCLALVQKLPPGWYPEFGHGRSISFLPPSGKIYQTELLMGGVSSFPLNVLKAHKFSEYFEGYGLYEDAEFTLRLSKIGKLYLNTAAQLAHHHDISGRPNKFKYGKMVVRNGWYVWRTKYPKPAFRNKLKWYIITLILTFIRATNIITTSKRKEAFTEMLGRLTGIISLCFNTPRK